MSDQPTSGVDWRKPREEGFIITLPSGSIARIRPVALDVLLKQGEIPDLLTPFVSKMIYDGVDPEEMSIEKLKEGSIEMLEFIDKIVTAAFMEPRIVEDPQTDDEITIEDVELADRGAVYSLAMLSASDLRTFLEQQKAGVELVSDSDGDGPAAEQSSTS